MSTEVSWNRKDALLHALGVGAHQMQHVYEGDAHFHALPSLITSALFKGASDDVVPFEFRGVQGLPHVDPNLVLHAEEYVEFARPLPAHASCAASTRLLGLLDKTSGALVVSETCVRRDGFQVARVVRSSFVRGARVDGAPRQLAHDPRQRVPRDVERYKETARAPDCVVSARLSPQQSVLYRLSGDYNPLHVSAQVARSVGFRAPILHGLAGLGFALRLVLETLVGGDGRRVNSFRCRFCSPMEPGQELHVKMWAPAHSLWALFEVHSRGELVISNGAVHFFSLDDPKASGSASAKL